MRTRRWSEYSINQKEKERGRNGRGESEEEEKVEGESMEAYQKRTKKTCMVASSLYRCILNKLIYQDLRKRIAHV